MKNVLWATLVASVLACSQTHAAILSGRVVKVADGDTVTVLDGNDVSYKIRLMGIDAPEKAQAFGKRSQESLSDLVAGQELRVDWSRRDRYGRVVGKLLGKDGKDYNLEQIRRGMAWHYGDYAREQRPADRLLYASAQDAARLRRNGLWSDAQPLPPWDFRREARRAGPRGTRVQTGNHGLQ